MDKPQQIQRAERLVSHALVEIKKHKWLPFGTHSAVLLDLSTTGFKLEFTGEVSSKPGEKYWLSIPLAPLGVSSPSQLLCRVECKWFDNAKYRIGGVFCQLTDSETSTIEHVVQILKDRGLSK